MNEAAGLERIERLADQGASDQHCQELEALLDEPTVTTQLAAARLLSQWQQDRSRGPLRAWLTRCCLVEHGTRVAKQAVQSYAPFLEPDDADWALDLYFTCPHPFVLMPLVAALPTEAVSRRIQKEIESSETARRVPACDLLRVVDIPDRKELLQKLSSDPSHEIAARARLWLEKARPTD